MMKSKHFLTLFGIFAAIVATTFLIPENILFGIIYPVLAWIFITVAVILGYVIVGANITGNYEFAFKRDDEE